jgi:tetratricopeptide (TPR) repeat protein
MLASLRSGERRWESLSDRERRQIPPVGIVDYFLEASYACRFEDPAGMVRLAKAACAVADSLSAKRYGRELTADLRAKAWAELGNAHRVADDMDAAGPALARAKDLASEGTRSSALLGRLAETFASYLTELREFNHSIPLLEEAASSYEECGDTRSRERALLNLAHTFLQANEPERAVITYLRVLRCLGPGRANRLAVVHGLAYSLVGCGLYELANVLVQRYRGLYDRSGKLNKLRMLWLEGKIAAGVCDYAKAEWKLHATRLGFLHVKKTYDAALVALDLAWVHARQGQRKQVVLLVEEMLRTFRSLGIARESLASLVLLKESCEERRSAEVLCGQIEILQRLLPELGAKKKKTDR